MSKSFSLEHINSIIKGELNGDSSVKVTGVNGIENVVEGDITFCEDKRHLKMAEESKAAAIIIPEKLKPEKLPYIIVDNPKFSFGMVLQIFSEEHHPTPSISQNSRISDSAVIGKEVYIGDFTVIEENSIIGDSCIIYPQVYIGANVKIGKNAILYPGVKIYYNSILGNNVIIHSNTVIGSDGFGYAFFEGRHHKVPQIGNVIIEDNVEIGASTTIDRATSSSTIIKSGVKIDNQVQIAHNVQVGENTLIISQVGVGGSVKIGRNSIIAGKVGVKDHIEIGDNVIVGALSGVTKTIKSGSIISGYPAKDHIEEKKLIAAYSNLPKILKTIPEISKSLIRLNRRIEQKK